MFTINTKRLAPALLVVATFSLSGLIGSSAAFAQTAAATQVKDQLALTSPSVIPADIESNTSGVTLVSAPYGTEAFPISLQEGLNAGIAYASSTAERPSTREQVS